MRDTYNSGIILQTKDLLNNWSVFFGEADLFLTKPLIKI